MDGNASENPTTTAVGSSHGDIGTLPSSSASEMRSVMALQGAPTSDAQLSLAELIGLYTSFIILNDRCDFLQLKVDPKLPQWRCGRRWRNSFNIHILPDLVFWLSQQKWLCKTSERTLGSPASAHQTILIYRCFLTSRPRLEDRCHSR